MLLWLQQCPGALGAWGDSIDSGSSCEEEGEGQSGKGRRGKRKRPAEEEDEAWELPVEQVRVGAVIGSGVCAHASVCALAEGPAPRVRVLLSFFCLLACHGMHSWQRAPN